MKKHETVHSTVVLEREYDVPVARAFTAFSDQAERASWDVPSDDWEVTEFVQEFRVGGRLISRFGPKGRPHLYSAGFYLDIEPDRRIVSAGTMHDDDRSMTSTLCTVEFFPTKKGTRVVLTDQSAYFGQETPEMRREGWGTIFDRLRTHLDA
jgi:uncharacterized protein YndB with AHSA1/START domain